MRLIAKKIENKNKDIANKFGEGKLKLEEVQKVEKNRLYTLGRSIEEIDLTIKYWGDLDEEGKITPSMASSGEILSNAFYAESDRLLRRIKNPDIENSLLFVVGITDTASTMMVSESPMIFSPQRLPRSYIQLRNFQDQKSNQEEIVEQFKSKGLDDLAIEYKNAWDMFFSSSDDRTRGAMALMRGVLDKLYYRFAPNERIESFSGVNSNFVTRAKRFLGLKPNKHITKRERIHFIASQLIKNENKRKVFLDAEDRFTKICDKLSEFKKHGPLNEENAKDRLYQADSLIRLFLLSIP